MAALTKSKVVPIFAQNLYPNFDNEEIGLFIQFLELLFGSQVLFII